MSNEDQPIEQRVETLLSSMTLAEKVGQLNTPIPRFGAEGEFPPPGTPEEFERFAEGTFNKDLGPGGGFYMLPHPMADPREQAKLSNRLQEIALTKTRLGIPLLQIAEGCHGVIAPGHTVFPEGLTLGSTWNPELMESVYAAVAREARAVGIHMLSTLDIEPVRDPRLGRNCEGYTEDPYLLSRLVEAIVRGAQGENVSAPDRACALLTCFPGQSEGVSGLERGAMEVSERTLREIFLPAWEAGIARAGALGVMATYPSIDGRVTHGSEWLLTKLLRDELGFEGITTSEGGGFGTLIYEGIVDSQAAAGALSIRAGVDVNITYEPAYLGPLVENVESGTVHIDLIDRAVRRILELKQRLGLFDNPFVDVDRAAEVIHAPEHQELALEAAREGIVLLKNDGDALPLSRSMRTIAVIGPNADAPINQLGEYTMAMMGQADLLPPIVTVLSGIQAAVDADTEILYAKGCDVIGDGTAGFAEAVDVVTRADVAIVVVGEQQGSWTDRTNPTTVGELADVASLDLSGVQEDLVRAVHATGTPIVVVLINGRPLSTRWIAENVHAIVEAWLPGERGGQAVADIIFGEYNPSGRLAITVPRHVGQLPVYYNQRWSKMHVREGGLSFVKDYVDIPAAPLYEFGFGLSYTRFEYSNLNLEPTVVGPDEAIHVSIDVTNVGSLAGKETVQLYIRDVLASIAPRWKQLRGFEKVMLDPGATTTVKFDITRDDLKMLDEHLDWVVEPGEFEVQVGASCRDIRGAGRFEVT